MRAAVHRSSAAKKTGPTYCWLTLSRIARIRCGAGQPVEVDHGLLGATVRQVLDGREDEVLLRREVVELSTAGDTGPAGHLGRRRPGPTEVDEALDRGVQKPLAHRTGAFLLRDPLWSLHSASLTHNPQTVKADCL